MAQISKELLHEMENKAIARFRLVSPKVCIIPQSIETNHEIATYLWELYKRSNDKKLRRQVKELYNDIANEINKGSIKSLLLIY